MREDAEGVSFNVPGNNGRYTLARRFTEKWTGRTFYVDRKSTEVFESRDGKLMRMTDAALREMNQAADGPDELSWKRFD